MTTEEMLILERANGYRQCYNDVLKSMIEFMDEYPVMVPIVNDLTARFKQQRQIREVSGWSHSEEIHNKELPL